MVCRNYTLFWIKALIALDLQGPLLTNYLLPSDVFLSILEPINLARFLDSTKRTVDLPALPKGKEDWGVSALPTTLTSSLGQGHSYPLQLVKGHSLFKSQIKHHFLQESFSDTQNRWSSLSISSNCSRYFPFIVVITLCHYSKLTHTVAVNVSQKWSSIGSFLWSNLKYLFVELISLSLTIP